MSITYILFNEVKQNGNRQSTGTFKICPCYMAGYFALHPALCYNFF